MSSAAATSISTGSPAALNSSTSTSAESSSKPKPCCVCKDEKAARDDCMLFSRSDDPAQQECRPLVEQYKSCMAGFGFKI
ncbi:cytochrome c oxidase assembly protein subunit 17 [Blastomyces silverae]|uniref:Cytochrome c oxidase assembly protein subunit 17 n=1 Tax=Blastomyces silverae TaxID=2060906 RepID=A0A0H1BFA1_9EURO|nr:cytochrome c oxidase assembly protein subunit 17 [Blastomyces silverae]